MMTPESTTMPTCECACVYVCVQCMKEVEHSEVMTPDSTTIPTCECACVYVCSV